MKLKQWIAMLLALTMVLGLCACGSKPETPAETDAPQTTEAAQPQQTEGQNEPTATDAPQITEAAQPLENVGAAMLGQIRSTVTLSNMPNYNFSEKALEYLKYIGESFHNRSFGGLGEGNTHDATAAWIVDELTNAGYLPQQIEKQTFEGTTMYGDKATGTNIILTVPGLDNSAQVIVGAHYDGDGLGDNGSGVALLLANATGLKDDTPKYTIKYVFFDAEEEGMIGSRYYASQMSEAEAASTIYMINLDALVFGDFCNIYGGTYGDYNSDYIAVSDGEALPEPEKTEAYDFAMDTAELIGIKTYRTEDLDGYYAEHNLGMELEPGVLFTNPWTNENPAPSNMLAPSPATIPAGDHVGFTVRGIRYIYFGATNWWATGTEPFFSFTGYVETYAYERGSGGMFMNTEYDTYEMLESVFPGRAEEHFNVYSPLLSALLLIE